MALRGSRIKNFDDLWCLRASGGLEFCVSSTSFQKSNIGWPQQPPTENLLKFNLIFHDSTKKTFFFKTSKKTHQNELNSRTWMTLNKVIFEPLETSATSLTSSASATSLASTASIALFPQKFSSP